MIQINRCPRIGEHGWQATVLVGASQVDILLIGQHADIVASAQRVERALRHQAVARAAAELGRVA